jgi:hypothetical protein
MAINNNRMGSCYCYCFVIKGAKNGLGNYPQTSGGVNADRRGAGNNCKC